MEKVRSATVDDYDWIQQTELSTYGSDAWKYTRDEWAKIIRYNNPNMESLDGNNVIRVYKNAYIQFSFYPQRGWYLTSIGGNVDVIDNSKDIDYLMKWFLEKEGERFYTHADPKWMNGQIIPFLKNYGFRIIGYGNVKKEIGKWAMDLSKLFELEFLKKNSPNLLKSFFLSKSKK